LGGGARLPYGASSGSRVGRLQRTRTANARAAVKRAARAAMHRSDAQTRYRTVAGAEAPASAARISESCDATVSFFDEMAS